MNDSQAGRGYAETPDEGNDRAVVAYLARNPDFLVRHPELLAGLQVPHGGSGAVSLIERQVAMLREQLATERRRLNHLVARAREYEQLSARLHDLTVALIVARDVDQACAALEEALRREFKADAVALKLFPVDPLHRAGDPLVNAFIDFIDRDRCLCGSLRPEQTETLFGAAAEGILSAAVVPLRGHDYSGVLAIGSTDGQRFTPDMGTDLLERLGAIAGAKLTELTHRRG